MNFQIKKNEKVITCSITGGNTREIKEATLKTAKTILDGYRAKFRKIRANGMDSVYIFLFGLNYVLFFYLKLFIFSLSYCLFLVYYFFFS